MYILISESSHPAPGIVSSCPSNWLDIRQASSIQITWSAPERPNGFILRYYLQLTTYDGRRVIVSTSVGNSTFLDDLDSSELRELYYIKVSSGSRDFVYVVRTCISCQYNRYQRTQQNTDIKGVSASKLET